MSLGLRASCEQLIEAYGRFGEEPTEPRMSAMGAQRNRPKWAGTASPVCGDRAAIPAIQRATKLLSFWSAPNCRRIDERATVARVFAHQNDADDQCVTPAFPAGASPEEQAKPQTLSFACQA